MFTVSIFKFCSFSLCLWDCFCLILTLHCPFSVVQFTRPLNLTLILFSEKLGLAHPDLPVGIARGECFVPSLLWENPSLNSPTSRIQPSSHHCSARFSQTLLRANFPTNYCRFHLFARVLFAIWVSFSLDHQLGCKALRGITYMSVWSQRFVFSERIPFVRHVAPRPGLHCLW